MTALRVGTATPAFSTRGSPVGAPQTSTRPTRKGSARRFGYRAETRSLKARKHICQARDQDADDDVPQVMGDWRSFRAKLVSETSESQQTTREATDNFNILRQQNPALAAEGLWCHPAQVEQGGIIVAQPDIQNVLGEDRYWQVVIFLIQHTAQGSVGLILNRPSGITMRALPVPNEDASRQLLDSFSENSLYFGGFNASQVGTSDGFASSKHKSMWRWRGSKHKDRTQFHVVSDDVVVAEARPVDHPFVDSRVHCGGFEHQEAVNLVHGYKSMTDCEEVVPGIYLGGQQDAMEAVGSGRCDPGEFRFFAGCKVWQAGELEQEIQAGAWTSAACSRSLVLKQCLGLPTPLWKEVMELMGGEYGAIARNVYGDR